MSDALRVDGDGTARCWWCGDDPLYVDYHDNEWGRPTDDDVALFEKLCLEGFQSGLSWITILRKRDNFRSAFDGFDPRAVSRFDELDVQRLLGDAGIVRHEGKIRSAVNNARRALDLIDEHGSLAAYAWEFAPPTGPAPTGVSDIASTSPESVAMSRDLKRRGWSFVGPTTVYAFMQAMGLVNDHAAGCDAGEELRRRPARAAITPPGAPGTSSGAAR